ncbi:hypothetical protein CSOJ01_00383 [Colletotrichum sojae]|uniref:Uncharacterized protein n=1 Tax=Colletotrichum sojae TaxID=2175907 RepID=A0A8H6JXP8_9PEZI|nr:hypothetical protein CSOJ01_00383 [Colletotrichum sojae]
MSTNLNPRHLQGDGSTPMYQNQAPPSKASTQHRSVGRVQGHYTFIKEKTEIIVQKYVNERDPDPDAESERHHVRQASYYSTGCDDQPLYKHLLASDVRRQVRQAPEYLHAQGKYPEVYENREPLQLQAEAPLTSHPIVPSPPRNWRSTNRPGPVRAVYNSNNREEFDVIYHDKNKQRGKDYDAHGKSKNAPFSLARHHPSQ